MTNLKAVNIGMNKFCGPAVLSILTGKSTDECAAVISRINGSYGVEGVQLNHLLQAADKLGFDQYAVDFGSSLYGTLVRLANEDGMYIITVPKHFVTIEVKDKKAYFCDNHTKEPIPASSSARLGQKVVAAHKVVKRPEPILINKVIQVSRIDSKLEIERIFTYENSRDNRIEWIGEIRAKDVEELRDIAMKIKDIFFRME